MLLSWVTLHGYWVLRPSCLSVQPKMFIKASNFLCFLPYSRCTLVNFVKFCSAQKTLKKIPNAVIFSNEKKSKLERNRMGIRQKRHSTVDNSYFMQSKPYANLSAHTYRAIKSSKIFRRKNAFLHFFIFYFHFFWFSSLFLWWQLV
jgi:hypothetical protein